METYIPDRHPDVPKPAMPTVTFVRPMLVSATDNYTMPTTPPLGLAYIAAAARERGADVHVVDALGEAPDKYVERDGFLYQGLGIDETVERIPADSALIGMTCMFTQDWPADRLLIAAIRERFPDVPIMMGGEHTTALTEWSLRDCPDLDFCALGEGEETIAEVVDRITAGQPFDDVAGLAFLRDGEFVANPVRARIKEVDQLPDPAWDLFPIENYLSSKNVHGVYRGRSMPIMATRGCPYQCTFCSNPVMYGTRWVARSPDHVLDEIQGYMERYGATDFPFWDLTMVLKRDWILDFTSKIQERGLDFTWQLPSGTRAEIVDEEVAAALHASGCRSIGFAPESGSEETLRIIKKKVNLERLEDAVRISLKQGMKVKCFFIIGFPHETRGQIVETLLFGWKMILAGIHDAPLFTFSPYPGSELFEYVREKHYPNGLDDKYFRSVASQTHLGRAYHYCENVGPRELNFWRVLGMGSFYLLGFVIRPWRAVQSVRNIFFGDTMDTHLETKVAALLERGRAASASAKAASAKA